MKTKKQPRFTKWRVIATIILIFLTCSKISADTHYVSHLGTGAVPPYTNWATATPIIQNAVDVATSGDTVLVANGVYDEGERVTPGYALSNRVVITKNITVRSASGPANTIILGAPTPGGGHGNDAIRCVYMEAGTLEGFTVSNGWTRAISATWLYDDSGGGIFLANGSVATNCVVTGNFAYYAGGGVACNPGCELVSSTIISNRADTDSGGGAICYQGGVIRNSTFTGNSAPKYGGGAYCFYGGVVSNCTFIANSCLNGGGAMLYHGGEAVNCTFSSNTATYGGGVYCTSGGMVHRSIITGNKAAHGGGAYCWTGGTLKSCLITGMNVASKGAGVFCYKGGNINNCTISGNNANSYGGGVFCYNGGFVLNSVIYYNAAIIDGANWHSDIAQVRFSQCCTTPTNSPCFGSGNLPDAPLFKDQGAGNYHLTKASPCIDVGFFQSWMTSAMDLDGNPRIHNGKVDIGAYEYLSGKIPVTSPNWKLKNKKKGVLNGKPITPLLRSYLTNGYGMGIWNLETDSNVDGPRQLTSKNKKETVWVFKDKTDKTAKIIYSEKYKKKKDIYKTKLKYVLQGQIPESNMVYIAPLE